MANQRKLGIYWGSVGISLVELNKDVPLASTFVSFTDLDQNPVIGIAHLSEDLRLLELLQKAIHSGSFSTGKVFLSFPSKDIIVRWFVIPWVRPEEIQGVVKFEAKKYIPFPLEDLIFNYYPFTINNKEGNRQIGIALTAIRKIHYERYNNVMVQAGLNVVYSEPSSMSLLRALVYKKIINTDEVCAIFTSHEDSGEIAIASQGYIKFIRDFSLRANQPIPVDNSVDFFREKLFNEVRMSLDYFARNNASPEVKKVIAVSSSRQQSLYDAMGEDISLPVRMVDPTQILDKFASLPSISYVRAFGVGLSGEVSSVINFNLSEGQVRQNEKVAVKKNKPIVVPTNIIVLVVAVLLVIVAFYACWKWSSEKISAKEALKQEVSNRLGRYLDMPVEDIDAKVSKVKKRIKDISSLSLKSTLTPVIARVVQLKPNEIWFEALDLTNSSAAPGNVSQAPSYGMSLSGIASMGDTNAEFGMINDFLERLLNDQLLKSTFTSIKLKLLQANDFSPRQKATIFTIEFK